MPGYVLLDVDKEDVPKKYLCSSCGLLLRDARQTQCGHFYCDTCVQTLVTDSKLMCLEDREECNIEQVYPDNFVRREVLSLVVRCPNTNAGCKWRGEVRHLSKHTAECDFQNVKCTNPGCDVMILRGQMSEHQTTECNYRAIPCNYCNQDIILADMEEHHEQCMKFPITCPKCNHEEMPRDQMSAHLDKISGNCTELEGPCPFSAIGCPKKETMNKDVRAAHLKDKMAFHLSLLQKDHLKLQERLAAQSASFQLNYPEGMTDQMIMDLVAKVDVLMQENVSIRRQLSDQNTQILAMARRLTDTASASSSFFPPARGSSDFDLDLRQLVVNVENRIAQFEVFHVDYMQRMNQQSEALTEIRHQVEETDSTQTAMETRLHAQETGTAMTSVAMADMEDIVRGLSLVTYDGILVWKIPDVARRRTDSASGRETSFYSHPFYSKRQGYKMCARIYLNGDGMGRGNSISLFFVIMRGEYDALLRWPFRQKVTLMLLDQDNVEHVIDAFRPDPTSSSFQRPRAKMNIASGCPMFCPLSELVSHAYIRDDTMFIKVIVDTIDA